MDSMDWSKSPEPVMSSQSSYWEMAPRQSQNALSFEQPQRQAPPTPVSNFDLSPPQFSSDDESDGDGSERGRESQTAKSPEHVDEDESNTRPDSTAYVQSIGNEESLRSLFGSRGSIHSDVLRRRKQMLEGITEGEENDGMNDAVMAVVWSNGKIGAAYYELGTSELYLLPDTAESAPDFEVLRSLFKQIMPRYMVVNARQDERMLKVVQELCGDKILGNPENPEEEGAEDDERREGNGEVGNAQVHMLQGKDFAPELCKQRMLGLKLPYEAKNSTPDEHNIFISSLVPFRSEIMIRAAGGLLRFLDKSAIELFQIDLVDGQVSVLNVKLVTMDGIVLVDDSAWKSLQIFSVDIHPSAVKQGNHSGSKEGLSVFSMLNHCSTVQGSRFLRLMLLRPSRSIDTLTRRHDVIEFCCNTNNMEFVNSAKDCLKSIKSLPKLLYKLSLLHASVAEWKDLYQTIYYGLLLGEICSSQPSNIELFGKICLDQNLQILKTLSQEMMRVVDFDESLIAGRIVARQGIDPLLDAKKQQYSCLPEIMALVAREEMQTLPGYVQQCCVVYIPEVGYLLAASLWREDLAVEDIEIEGLEFKFKTNELAYYKSPRTRELDVVLGDCSVAILEKETSIMICITECIIGQSSRLLAIGSLLSELDCLISMSTVAKNNGFVRPQIISFIGDQQLEIINGRHPLVEMICDFVPNTTKFEFPEKTVILTGPNASGKSIYLKQVGVIVIMALSGSFVPASHARIPMYDRICTRIHATESISTGFSSFMIDLSQMSMALRMSTKQSLVIIDEFGKGTAEADGLALLAASMEEFVGRMLSSPTVFLSTHFYSLQNYMNCNSTVKMQSMKFIQQRDGPMNEITYLYELQNGICSSSFAHLVAENTGIPKDIVERSHVIQQVINNELSEECLVNKTDKQVVQETTMLEIADHFLSLDLNDIDPLAYLASIRERLSGESKNTQEQTRQ